MEKIRNRTIIILLAVTLSIIFVGYLSAEKPPAQTSLIPDGYSLIEKAKELNGTEVSFQGEVVGDIMPRQDHFWLNVSSNGTAIGIWITDEQRTEINLAGRFGIRGDEVKIIGIFNQACAEHGGDMDIHAKSVEIISEGDVIPQGINWLRLIIATCLLIVAVCLLIALNGRRYHRNHPIIK